MIDRGYPQFITRLEKSGIAVVSLQPATVNEMYDVLENPWGFNRPGKRRLRR